MAYYSAEFKALIGLLTGDPASPILWNLFLADLSLPPDFDDVFLAADDLLLLASLEHWVNMVKTVILIFGPTLFPTPAFRLGTTQLKIETTEKYVGVNIRTDLRNMFADHYDAKSRTARYYMTGRLTPKELKQLYMARISPDTKVQISFLRQMLNMHKTGIMPLRVRRLILALGYLCYLLDLPDDHYARAALNSSLELAINGKKSWVNELTKAAARLPFHCPDLILTRHTSKADVENYSKVVQKLMMEWLQAEIDSTDKLYLLHGRREPQKEKGPTQVTSCMRHYLSMVKTQKHREAITSIMLSTHQLAVEVLRYVDHAHQPVPRSERLCRLCRQEVESPEHALITCQSSDKLIELRAVFLAKLFTDLPQLHTQMAELSNTEFLKAIIYPRSTIALVAKFAYEVLEVFYEVPVFRGDN
ncbi:hypothetical protein B0H12DRAFT_1209080 [Mycena haematopus]|nr:hypothetical protein B0H12DRAFT_1209080 [Mycena haematopus]